QGRAVFDGPAPPLPFTFRLVVFKQGFQTADSQETMTNSTLSRDVVLLDGTSTPPTGVSCAVLGSNPPQTIIPAISITNFKINGGSEQTTDRTLTLSATFSSPPGVFRAGEGSDLSGRPWVPMNANGTATYQLNAVDERGISFGVRQVRFQVAPTASGA